jgi:hypothetical protein
MRFRALGVSMAVAIGCSSATGFAHHSFAGEFDNSIAVTLQGVVTSVEMINPHSFIYLDVQTQGRVERWALEGPAPRQVLRMGLQPGAIKPGDEVGACGYLARHDVVRTRSAPGAARPARKLQAAVLTTPHSGTMVWNNYRQGKCGLDK